MLGIWKEIAKELVGRASIIGLYEVWAHQDSNLGPSDYESDALTN